MASFTYLNNPDEKLPTLLSGSAEEQLRDLSQDKNDISILELSVIVATVRQLQGNLAGRGG